MTKIYRDRKSVEVENVQKRKSVGPENIRVCLWFR